MDKVEPKRFGKDRTPGKNCDYLRYLTLGRYLYAKGKIKKYPMPIPRKARRPGMQLYYEVIDSLVFFEKIVSEMKIKITHPVLK